MLPGHSLPLDRVRIMGILNITPDSFYDRGRYGTPDVAVARALEMAGEGADIIDVGGERAGPGPEVTAESEKRRVIPLVEAIRRRIDLPVSVDTWKPAVAAAAMDAGASIINSIGGFDDPAMREVAARTGAAVVVMHIQGQPRVANPHPRYTDVVREVEQSLAARVEACLAAGIAPDRIVIDPGPGFGKSSGHDLTILRHLDRLTAGPYPVLLAASRKTFIGDVLGLDVDERLEGSLAVTAWAVLRGVRIVRTHDVRATKRVAVMTEAVLHPEIVGGERG